jgi:hypothetical protein
MRRLLRLYIGAAAAATGAGAADLQERHGEAQCYAS